jgi:hypothetical protein
MSTKAEELFEQFCGSRGIPCHRISETLRKTPDYEIVLGTTEILVEVKQLEPNDEDRAFFERLRTEGHASEMVDMGRARPAIHDAMKQLGPHARGRKPALVVLHDTMGSARGYLDAYKLAYCLYGSERVHYLVPNDPGRNIVYAGMSRGGRSVATAHHNTTLSAVAILHSPGLSGIPDLTVFHNLHARIPLPVQDCAAYGIPQHRFAPAHPGEMPDWIPISERAS